MLRHIVLVSLAMISYAALMTTKANAATLTITPVGTLQRNPGDSIEFILAFNPNPLGLNTTIFSIIDYNYDGSELSFSGLELLPINTVVTNTTTVARLKFDVINPGPIADGSSDLNAKVIYQEGDFDLETPFVSGGDVVPVPEQPVPEPLTMLGAATALGYGALFKRKYSEKKKS